MHGQEVIRVVSVATVVLHAMGGIEDKGTLFLIETAQSGETRFQQTHEARWPGHKVQQGESFAEATHRMLVDIMHIPMCALTMTRQGPVQNQFEEATAYAGLRTLYHEVVF